MNVSRFMNLAAIFSLDLESQSSLSKHMGDGKVKLGRGPYAIYTAIISMYAGFQHPGTKYMIAPNILLFLRVFFHVVFHVLLQKFLEKNWHFQPK